MTDEDFSMLLILAFAATIVIFLGVLALSDSFLY